MSILLLLILFLGLFGFSGWSAVTPDESTSQSQQCAVGDGVERCGPTLINERYQLAPSGPVIEARVNNGPVAPDAQAGYLIVIEPDGTVTITETPAGASSSLDADARTAEETVRTEQIGEEGVQRILNELDRCNFYYLPQRDEVDPSELPDGGGISILRVMLVDGEWEVFDQTLQTRVDRRQFDACQALLVDQFQINVHR